jgi:hypothetical protein
MYYLSHGFHLKDYDFLFILPFIVCILLLQKPVWRVKDIRSVVILHIDKPAISYGKFTATFKPEKTETNGTNDDHKAATSQTYETVTERTNQPTSLSSTLLLFAKKKKSLDFFPVIFRTLKRFTISPVILQMQRKVL